MRSFQIGDITIGDGKPFVLFSGPCVIESERQCLDAARQLRDICGELDVPLIFKSSYDKANRSSIQSFRGPGVRKGLAILEKVKSKLDLPVLSDIHTVEEARAAAVILDVMQIPAFLCRQTDLVVAIAETGNVVNIKKGQFLAPWDVRNVIDKVTSTGNRRIIVTERGCSFGYNNLVVDFKSLPIIRQFGYPVCFDATHSVQLPGGAGTSSGGQREFVEYLLRASLAVGTDAVFLETHDEPDSALSDGPNMLPIEHLKQVIRQAKILDDTVKNNGMI